MPSRPKRAAASKVVSYVDSSPTEENNRRRRIQAVCTPIQFSPTALARKLDDLRAQLSDVKNIENVLVELKGFDLSKAESLEEYARLREEIKKQTGDPDMFDENGRTELNVEAAAIAGAKMVIDSERSTRSLSKKLAERAGITEDDILYKGLPNEGPEQKMAQDINATRKASLYESLVDFQKQIHFKINVLKRINVNPVGINNLVSKSDGKVTRGRVAKEALRKNTEMKKTRGRPRKAKSPAAVDVNLHTPIQNTAQPNPLDDKRIYEDYASNIASEMREAQRKRRRTAPAPIPFNLHLLDDSEGSDMETTN